MATSNTNIPNIDLFYDTKTAFLPYRDTNGYRDMVRVVFKMDNKKSCNIHSGLLTQSDLDDESWDEIFFDSDSITKGMDMIYDITENHHLFAELYEIAAAQMLSTNPTIGHAVLMSYDYYYMYHTCLCHFIESPETFNEKSESYLKLKMAFMK